MIYFVQIAAKVMKVGFAQDVRARMRQLQTASPVVLRLVREIGGNRDLEAEIHRRLTRNGFRIRGEWFAIDADQVSWIVDDLSMDGLVPW